MYFTQHGGIHESAYLCLRDTQLVIGTLGLGEVGLHVSTSLIQYIDDTPPE